MTARIFLKLIFAVCCVLVVSLLTVDFLASRVAESTYIETLTRELGDKNRLVTLLQNGELTHDGPSRIRELAHAAGGRLTVVAPDGRVLADSEAHPEQMENHRNRPEIAAALEGRQGSIRRQSPTMGVEFLYVATPIPGGAMRLAVPLSEIRPQVDAMRRQMLTAIALAFIPAIGIAAFFARHVSSRLGAIIEHAAQLAQGNFRARLERAGRDELGTLGRKLNETGENLERMFEQLQKEQVELEKLERIRKDFVVNVSHELRTPLASIQGYTETLLDGALHEPENNVRFLSIIRQNAERLGRLTADLLTLSRLELKSQKFQFSPYYINALLENSIESMHPIAAKKAIAFTFDPAPDRTEVFCDAEAVHQMLANLLDNALKYTPAGGRVTVGARTQRSEQTDFVEIFVRDTGAGIPAEELPRLFERFYRVDKARSRELGGTGLGLSIVKHLARAHGGEARVESTVGEGSTFSFTLPVQEVGAAASVHAELTLS